MLRLQIPRIRVQFPIDSIISSKGCRTMVSIGISKVLDGGSIPSIPVSVCKHLKSL